MFKKLHSNRNPKDTLSSQIKKEFSVYFERTEQYISAYLIKYPSQIFKGMIAVMLVSIVVSFSLSRSNKNISSNTSTFFEAPTAGTNSINQLMETGSAIKETIVLKREIESIISRKILSKTDTSKLKLALDRLESLNKSIK